MDRNLDNTNDVVAMPIRILEVVAATFRERSSLLVGKPLLQE
jgi:hypothetical protein